MIFNSRANLDAEVVFSDNSHDPRTIYKHSAVQVDPSGATALADAHATGKSHHPGKSHKPTKTVKHPPPTINEKINCKVAKQVPRVPVLVAGDRAARSIGLQWIYNRLDPSDCLPSTYIMSIEGALVQCAVTAVGSGDRAGADRRHVDRPVPGDGVRVHGHRVHQWPALDLGADSRDHGPRRPRRPDRRPGHDRQFR